ncbi:hypothetical protein [Haloechinothrix salitolerans]|uniref:Type VII secretion protein EccB n=1 Tax=Haloechinothrix salitolerans TaxID=926830 RepID=A0ABW2BUR0_9PSEU
MTSVAHGLVPSSTGNGAVLAVAIALGCAVVALGVLVPRGRARRHRRSPSMVALTLTAAMLTGVATYLVGSDTHAPEPGVPYGTQISLGGERVGVVIAPHRPGVNLVHISRKGVLIGLDRERLRATTSRPGAGYGWATVRLRKDTETLWLSRGDDIVEVPISPGDTAPADVGFAGPDGPECLSLAHGALLADKTPPNQCPSGRLGDADAAALREAMRFISDRGHEMVRLVGDDSPRSAAAEDIVRSASERHGIRVCAGLLSKRSGCPARPIPAVVVAGWEAADAAVNDLATGTLRSHGTYLAPWLLTPGLLTPPAGQVIPLRYPAMDKPALRYLTAAGTDGFAVPPSTGGYLAWREDRDDPAEETVRMYASASLTQPFEHHTHHASWLPGGSVVPISNPLQDTSSR